jgi:PAT family acetyl-CoA transporter-like MFS transporter 1
MLNMKRHGMNKHKSSAAAVSSSSHAAHLIGNTGEIELTDHTDHKEEESEDAESANLLESHAPSAAANVGWRSEWQNILLLVSLYTLQGVPLGLCFGSIPFLLQQAQSAKSTNYTDLGIFSLAVWPYSLKLLWSPIVDCYYSEKLGGRRKSWIIPTQLLIGLCMAILAYYIEDLIHNNRIHLLAILFFFLIILVATQDIAVDGWALTLLSSHNLSYASTSQSIGQNIGYFLSYSVFLALNEFGYTNLSQYLFFWGVAFILCTLYLAFFQAEAPTILDKSEGNIIELYLRIWRILKLKPVQKLVFILFTARLAFVCIDNITILKLTERGFPRETMAVLVFILFPFEMIFPILITNYSKKQGNSPITTWINGYPLRMIMALMTILSVAMFPGSPIPFWFYICLILMSICSSFTSNIHFVSQCAFFAQISDSSIGGTYMTLLNTVANLGSTWPKFIVFAAVDMFTCKKGDKCAVISEGTDGYYVVSLIGLSIGIVWLALMRPHVVGLAVIPKKLWSTQ